MEGGGGRRGDKGKRLPANPMIFLSSLPLPPSRTFFKLAPIFARSKSENASIKPVESPTAYGNACNAGLPTSQWEWQSLGGNTDYHKLFVRLVWWFHFFFILCLPLELYHHLFITSCVLMRWKSKEGVLKPWRDAHIHKRRSFCILCSGHASK